MRANRNQLTIVCENYWPELTSTGQLITDLAEGLAADFEVEILTTGPRFNSVYEKRPSRESKGGVNIHRLWATSFSKESRTGRLVNWLTFLASVSLAVARRRDARTFLFVTNPPTAPWALPLARSSRQPSYVLVHDLYPDLAEAIGVVRKGSLIPRVFDTVNKLAFRRANGIVALGADMRRRLEEKLGPSVNIAVIPNWANGQVISPRAKGESTFARANGLVGKFVFLYAGNLGLFQDLETLVAAIESLPAKDKEPALVFVGNGGKRKKIEALAAGSKRIQVHDFVPYEELGDLYAAADVGLIALEPGVEKTNVPSKTYSILSAGKPFLAVCTESTDLQSLAHDGCGFCVENDAVLVAAAMSKLMSSEATRDMGLRAREVFEERFNRTSAVDRYRELLLANGSSTPDRLVEPQVHEAGVP